MKPADSTSPPSGAHPPVVLTAVLPRYRQNFLNDLAGLMDVRFFAGSVHADASVVTAVADAAYQPVKNVFLANRRLFIQVGGTRAALRAPVTVVDLNPRSLTAWAVLVTRRLTRRRVLAWGHIFPRGGPGARSMVLRRAMMSLADGVIAYTVSDRERAREISGKPAWAATNALYSSRELSTHRNGVSRTDFLYVGRLERDKKPQLLLDAFARAWALGWLRPDSRLRFVGAGELRQSLQDRARFLGVSSAVQFDTPKYSSAELSDLYKSAIAAVSPGFGGLLITQCVGFGRPILLPRGEPHAPEVELAKDAWTRWFDKDSPDSLAMALKDLLERPPSEEDLQEGATFVRTHYSTDCMARGFADALRSDRRHAH